MAKVAFTGSTATGKKVMASAAGTLKRLTLELGGNDAAIVLDDADPKEVAPKIYAAAMFNSGQGCIAIKRLYVHDSIYDAVCDELGRLARATVVGDGLEPGTQMGPLQNPAKFERVKGFLEDARRNGKIVAGGSVLEREGYFVQPTIVRDISDDARLVREEQFGPVLPVLRYSEIDDAIARANDTDFGLGGSVWSSDRDRAFAVAARIDSGTVWVNKHLDVATGHPIRRREAVWHRGRDGPGGTRGVHPGDHHQHGEISTFQGDLDHDRTSSRGRTRQGARQQLRLCDRRRRFGGLRGRASPVGQHRRHGPAARGGRTGRRPQPLEPAALGGERRLAIRLETVAFIRRACSNYNHPVGTCTWGPAGRRWWTPSCASAAHLACASPTPQ